MIVEVLPRLFVNAKPECELQFHDRHWSVAVILAQTS
jgi:hypothetical protein